MSGGFDARRRVQTEPSVGSFWRFDAGAVGDAIADVLRAKSLPRKVEVPDVVGMAVSEARHALARAGLRPKVERVQKRPPAVEGRVIAQSPAPGTTMRRHHRVRLLLTFLPDGPQHPL
jgi:beta-lactam-binding protein with PASTA domain